MSVLSVKNKQDVLIGKNIGRTVSVQITNPDASAYIADGEIVVLDSSGAVATTSTTYPGSEFIQVVQRSGSNLIYSDRIYGDKVTSYKGKDGAAGAEQIYHVGYDGVTSTLALDVTSGLDYLLSLQFNHDDMMWSEQKQKYQGFTLATTGTTQALLAKDMATQLSKAYVKNAIPVTTAMLNSGAATAFTVASGTLTCNVVHGSNVITFNLAVTNSGFGAGSIVRLGANDSSNDSGRGVRIPVYTVKEAHPTISNAYVLDQPYMGPSNSALKTANMGLVTAGASWGLRITGKSLPYVKDFFTFKRVSFTVGLSGFGVTPITKTQEASYGQGDGRIVAQEESFCKGFLGALNRMTVPLPSVTFDADSTTTSSINTTYGDAFTGANQLYETISIGYFGRNDQVITAGVKMPSALKLFLIDSAGQNAGSASDIQDVLNAWMASTPTGFANLFVA